MVVEAERVAFRAAAAAGVHIGAVTKPQVPAVQELVASVWGESQRPQSNLLLAMAHSGGTLGLAVSNGTPVGFCMGWLAWDGGLHVHSHMVAVHPQRRVPGVGFALKLWQRAVSLRHDVHEVRWTYDPLVGRNAHFNAVKLGARVTQYWPDFYGAMDDVVNAGDHSDRFEVSWSLDDPTVSNRLAGRAQSGPIAAADDAPLVKIPRDYESLRAQDPSRAGSIRDDVRKQIAYYWAEGLRPHWTSEGGYRFLPIDLGAYVRGDEDA